MGLGNGTGTELGLNVPSSRRPEVLIWGRWDSSKEGGEPLV